MEQSHNSGVEYCFLHKVDWGYAYGLEVTALLWSFSAENEVDSWRYCLYSWLEPTDIDIMVLLLDYDKGLCPDDGRMSLGYSFLKNSKKAI
jgi:hypothetical protein